MPEQITNSVENRNTFTLPPSFLTTLTTLVKRFITIAAGAAFSRALNAVAGILIVRYFSNPTLYGQYATLTTQLALMSSLLGLGIDTWLLREGGRDLDQLVINSQRLITAKGIITLVLLTCLIIAWQYIGLSWIIVVGMIGVISESYIRTGYVIMHVLNRNQSIALLQSVDALVAVGLIILLMNWPPHTAYLIIGQTAISITLLGLITRLLGTHWYSRWTSIRLIDLIRSAGFFILADIFANIHAQSYFIILALLTSDTAIGIFRAAVNLISISFLVPIALFNVTLPWLSRTKFDRMQRKFLVQGMIIITAVYGLSCLILFWWFGKDIIHLIYGDQYSNTFLLLRIMSIIPLFKSLSFVAVATMLSLEAQRLRIIIQGIVTVLSVIGGIIGVMYLGLEGAVWSYVIIEGLLSLSYGVGAIVTWRKHAI